MQWLTLKKVCGPPSHPGVDVRFAGFDVVMEVVSERLNVRDDLLSALRCEMSREQH